MEKTNYYTPSNVKKFFTLPVAHGDLPGAISGPVKSFTERFTSNALLVAELNHPQGDEIIGDMIESYQGGVTKLIAGWNAGTA